MNRRNFLKGLGAGALGLFGLGIPLNVSSKKVRYNEAFLIWLNNFNKVYRRAFLEINEYKLKRNSKFMNSRDIATWFEIIQKLKRIRKVKDILFELMRLLSENDSSLLKLRYITDNSYSGKEDYYKTPFEFLLTDSLRGDCEDFVLLWYFTLLEVGVLAEDMFLVVGEVPNYGGHACLYVKVGYEFYVLDNLFANGPILDVEHSKRFNINAMFYFDKKTGKIEGYDQYNYFSRVFGRDRNYNKLMFSEKDVRFCKKSWLEVYGKTLEDIKIVFDAEKIGEKYSFIRGGSYVRIKYWFDLISSARKQRKIVSKIKFVFRSLGPYIDLNLKGSMSISYVEDDKSYVKKLTSGYYSKTPFETLYSGMGDYDDIVVLWYFFLLQSGVLEKDLFILCGKSKLTLDIVRVLCVRIGKYFVILDAMKGHIYEIDNYFEIHEFGVAFSGRDGKEYNLDFFLK